MAASSRSSAYSTDSTPDYAKGQGFALILDHILTYSGSYDIPLRTMYTLNSTPRAQPSRPGTPSGAPMNGNVTTQFQSSLLNQVSAIPHSKNQDFSLPPSFITSFVRKCFPDNLTLVDFPQALTALDYLKDLERRRRREFKSALERVGLDADILSNEAKLKHFWLNKPGVKNWFDHSLSKERKVESYYSHVYVALRRWILINELSLEPFSRHNCIAMLNTLYPPPVTSARGEVARQPTQMLTEDILTNQRMQFFNWIGKVEADGTEVLRGLMEQGRRPPYRDPLGNMKTDENGWPAVRDALDAYLRVANAVIEECSSVSGLDDFSGQTKTDRRASDESTLVASGRDSRSGRKADSGVSFNSESDQHKRASTSGSFSTRDRDSRSAGLPDFDDGEEETSPSSAYDARFPPAKTTGGSSIEKIAREVKAMRVFRSSKSKSKARPETPSPTDSTHQEESARGRGRGRERRASAFDEGEERPQSRAGAFIRSFSRVRSRSRPATATGDRDASRDEVPPTPTIPASFMEYSDDERESGSKIRRSFSRFRSRSNSRGNTLRKMKSFGDSQATTGRRGERAFGSAASDIEGFDVHQMRAARDRWKSENASVVYEDEAEAYGIGEAR